MSDPIPASTGPSPQPEPTPPGAQTVRSAQPAGVLPTMMARPVTRPAWQVALGLILVLPAFVLLMVSYVEPTIWTVRASFHKVNVLQLGAGGGLDGEANTANYQAAFDGRLPGSFGFALSLAIVPIIVVLLAAPLLAWAAHLGGTATRWVTRALLALPLAAYAPMAIVTARFVDRRGFEPSQAAEVVRGAYWSGTFGLVAALAATLFLATLRRRDPRRSPWPALAVAGGIALAATVAAALQEFTYPHILTAGGRATTPAIEMYSTGFARFQFGLGAVYATLLLAVLATLGLAVTVMIVLSGLRLEFDDRRRSADQPSAWPATRVAGVAATAVVLLMVIVVALVGIGPMLGKIFSGSAPQLPVAAGTVQANTWLPPLVSTLVGVLMAAAAAFGISWLRPLGRHSEWLLLPFGLFLFVGVGPLALRAFAAGQAAGRINSFWGLVPPSWVAVPALFVLALMFRGQALHAEALRQVGRRLSVARQLVPVLPLAAVVFLAMWVVRAQDLLWPLLMANSPEHMSAPVTLLLVLQQYGTGPDALPYNLVLPVAVFVLLLLLAIAAQLLYLDRVALRVGRPEREEAPRT